MQDGKILDICVKENNVTVAWYLPKEDKTQEKEIPLPQPRIQKKHSVIKNIVIATIKQICTFSQQTPEIIFTKAALEKMGTWGLSENKVNDAVLHGKYIRGKENMLSKKYNGYEVGVLVKHTKATNTYLVLSAWKRGRR